MERGTTPVDPVLRLSALLLLVHLLGSDPLLGPVELLFVLAGLALTWPLSTGWFWGGAFVFLSFHLFGGLAALDNHFFLSAYWVLVLALSHLLPESEREEVRAHNGRLLVGLCMLFATAWKLIAPDYVDGSFLELTLFGDSRFHDLARVAGGVDGEVVARTRTALQALRNPFLLPAEYAVTLGITPRVGVLARLFTWGGVGFEALLAAAFLVPSDTRLGRARHWALMLFCATVYSALPIVGFGVLLLIMGYAQCRPEERRTRWAYLGTMALVELYGVPYLSLL